jgi:penicillin amidase
MRIGTKRWLKEDGFDLRRTPEGVIRIRAADDLALSRGLGFAHANDRFVAMVLLRLVAQGRLAECVQTNEETVSIDVFMRQLGLRRSSIAEVTRLSDDSRAVLEAYCAGVNAWMSAFRRPAALVAVGCQPEPWAIEDCLAIIKVMGYIGLAQTQADLERFLVQAIAAGVSRPKLKALFGSPLDALDDELATLLANVQLHQPLVPPAVRFASALPHMKGSNNWAVAASRTATGGALQCNDPHLEVNRLPPIWYEFVGHLPDDYRAGISLPGVPGLVMGRTKRLSAGFTYGFMDMVDFFVEEIRDGKARRGDSWVALDVHEEIVERRNAEPLRLEIRETVHGVLEVDPTKPVPDGFHLSRAWSFHRRGAAESVAAMHGLVKARGVEDGMKAVRGLAISSNWLLADRDGRIAYQQAGLMPKRRGSGMLPLPGWDPANDWTGFVDPAELVSELDPPSGVLVTANENRNRAGYPAAINAAMSPSRAERIAQLLGDRQDLGVPDMKAIQSDLYSLQAERLLAMLKPVLPDTPEAARLRQWDRRYDVDSRGAVVFEHVYAALLREVFGREMFGEPLWDHLVRETSLVADYFGFFDDVLHGENPLFFGPSKMAVLRRVVNDALADAPRGRWGDERRIVMTNVLLGGKLPRFTGVDHGPIELPGGRATIVQGSLFRAHGRVTTFAPSWRYITDLGRDAIFTALPGGPSGSRLSSLYLNDLPRWLAFDYKRTDLGSD